MPALATPSRLSAGLMCLMLTVLLIAAPPARLAARRGDGAG